VRNLRNHRLIVAAVAVLVTGVVAAGGYAISGLGTSVSPSQVALSPSEQSAVEQRAAIFRTRAHELIQERSARLGSESVQAGAPPDALAIQAMRAMAFELAALNGETHPRSGVVLASNRQNAQKAITGAGVDTDQPAFVAVFHGNFIGYAASPPPGGNLPAGKVMTITFDADTLAVTDWGIQQDVPDTATLGPATPLGLP
jgi:hypothetical protein